MPACSNRAGNLALREGARFQGRNEKPSQPLTSAFPAGTLSSLYTQQNDFGLLGLKLTNYVNFIQIDQTCLVPVTCTLCCESGQRLNGSHFSYRQHFISTCCPAAFCMNSNYCLNKYSYVVVAAQNIKRGAERAAIYFSQILCRQQLALK